LSEWTGVVVAKSENGIKVIDKGKWLNWSLPDYRGTPFDSNVKAGDRVRIEYSEVEKNGEKRTYISVIENLSRPQADAPQVPAQPFPSDDPPFPPDDEMPFPPESSSFPPDAPGLPSEAPGQDLWAKDRLRARTDCIACATGIFKSCLEAGIYKEFPSPETVVDYAATLELWAKE
jgi:hypothetical protein